MVRHIYRLAMRLLGRGDWLARLQRRGLTVGRDVSIEDGCIIDPDHCWHITIGDEVTLAPNVHILAHDASTKRHLGYTRIAKVRIGNRVFIGAGSIIMPGVTIGDDVIIGAGSVVTRDIPSRVVAVGVPARVIDVLDAYLERQQKMLNSLPRFGREYTESYGVSAAQKAEMNEKMSAGSGFIV